MTLPVIPLIDVRDGGTVELLKKEEQRARMLIRHIRRSYSIFSEAASILLMPRANRMARGWLVESKDPYLHEIDNFSEVLKLPGIHALNLSYEWGCTSGAQDSVQGPELVRVLDWPFKNMGAHVVVAHQRGKAGEFYNVTWPAVSGMIQGMAPGRFAACINQAPMRRHGYDIVTDWIINRRRFFKTHVISPTHLLRKVFEEAASFDEAKKMLSETPLALPVIYVLSGTKEGETCVIERMENEANIIEGAACTGNHWQSESFQQSAKGWRARGVESHKRFDQMKKSPPPVGNFGDMAWFAAPVANSYTRLVMRANAGKGVLHVLGTEGLQPVTQPFQLAENA